MNYADFSISWKKLSALPMQPFCTEKISGCREILRISWFSFFSFIETETSPKVLWLLPASYNTYMII